MEPSNGETTLEKMMMSQASKSKSPINGSIELLPLCNMNCDMCYVRLSRHEMESQGRLRTKEEWISLGKQMQEAEVLFLLLTGGEPLLYPDFEEVYLALRRMGFIITINTNGTLIDEKWADFFGKYKPRRINITVYGKDNDAYEKLCHYPMGYDKVIHGIQLLSERGVDVKIGCSMTKSNQNDLDDLLSLEEKLGVPVRVDTYMMPSTRERGRDFNHQSRLDPVIAANLRIRAMIHEMGVDSFRDYAYTMVTMTSDKYTSNGDYTHMTCLAGSCSFTINWQGNMRPCVVMSGPSVNVFKLGFNEAWKKLREETDMITLSPTCASCHLRILCRTCAASALFETGSYDGVPEYMCIYTKESLRLIEEWIVEDSHDR